MLKAPESHSPFGSLRSLIITAAAILSGGLEVTFGSLDHTAKFILSVAHFGTVDTGQMGDKRFTST